MRRFATLIALALVSAACNPTPDARPNEEAVAEPAALETAEEQTEERAGQQEEQAPRPGTVAWSKDALVEQPRMNELRAGEHHEPASTEWRAAEYDVPDSMTRLENPAQLMHALAYELRFVDALGVDVWEQTIRVHQEEEREAHGVILRWGIKDDSIAGMDLLVRMTTEDQEFWHIEEMQERVHCRRGVSNGLCQ